MNFGSLPSPKRGWYLVYASLIITCVLWLGSLIWYDAWQLSVWVYLGKASAFSSTILMGWAIILATRAPFLTKLFGGLDKVYHAHKQIGKWAFYLVLGHPIALALRDVESVSDFFGFFRLFIQDPSLYEQGHNIGIYALLGFFALIAVSMWVYLPYHVWKLSHNFFGLVFALVAVHVILVDAHIQQYPLFGVWMYIFITFALLSAFYTRVLYRFIGPRYAYSVHDVELVEGVYEITLKQEGPKMMVFYPGQFAYLSFGNQGVTPELHPYSMACAPNAEGMIKFGIKNLGDHTKTLHNLNIGDPVSIYGPYGTFAQKFLSDSKECIFIGGGIGITPFQSMWDAAINSDDIVRGGQPSVSYNPKQVNQWKSPIVHLFYVVKNAAEASFHNDIIRESLRSQFNGANVYHERGHSYHLYEADKLGYITADYIEKQVGSLKGKYIFMCGPGPMTSSLIKQFKDKGIPNHHIITEDFNLLNHKRGRWYQRYLPRKHR